MMMSLSLMVRSGAGLGPCEQEYLPWCHPGWFQVGSRMVVTIC